MKCTVFPRILEHTKSAKILVRGQKFKSISANFFFTDKVYSIQKVQNHQKIEVRQKCCNMPLRWSEDELHFWHKILKMKGFFGVISLCFECNYVRHLGRYLTDPWSFTLAFVSDNGTCSSPWIFWSTSLFTKPLNSFIFHKDYQWPTLGSLVVILGFLIVVYPVIYVRRVNILHISLRNYHRTQGN